MRRCAFLVVYGIANSALVLTIFAAKLLVGLTMMKD
jgi:hypothetical protein